MIQDEGDELTVVLGDIAHRHFGSHDSHASANEQAEQIAAEVTEYLQRVFNDEIEFYRTGSRGGARARSTEERGFLSKVLLGGRTFRWSGPLDRNET